MKRLMKLSRPHMATLTETLLNLIDSSGLTLKEIAEKSGVPYQSLRRWVKGKRGGDGRSNRTLDADSADSVYRMLAGKTYVEGTDT
jgi:predicted transcriptional regulator